MTVRAGLFLHNGRITVAAIAGPGKVERFTLEASENPAALLAAELEARGLAIRGTRVGLDRGLVTVKALELPRAAGGELAQMVGFEVERHVPLATEEISFGWHPLPGEPDGPLRVLVAACDRRTVERSLRLMEELKRRPLALTVACHDLRELLPRTLPARQAVWAHRHSTRTDLLFFGPGGLELSRSVPVEDAGDLTVEIQRSLTLLRWSECETLWVSGDDTERFLSAPALAALGAPVSEPPYAPGAAALVAALPAEERGAAMLALAVAAGSRRPPLNLLPEEQRPWTLSRAQLVTATTAAITILLGLALLFAQGYQKERYLNRLSQEIRRLDPEVKAVERLVMEVRQQKRLVATLRSVQKGGVRALPVVRELTELLPQDAWLQSLSMDAQGVEVTGQANAANQLIPLLENSAWLERVEFTSPVTTMQNKEQFRLKAAWKAGAAQRAAATGPAGGAR